MNLVGERINMRMRDNEQGRVADGRGQTSRLNENGPTKTVISYDNFVTAAMPAANNIIKTTPPPFFPLGQETTPLCLPRNRAKEGVGGWGG